MSWIDILKRQEVAQTSQTGMAPIDIQKPFKRVKDKSDCYDEFAAMTKRVMASFPNGSKLQEYKGSKGEHGEYAYDNFYIRVDYDLEEKGKIPDEVYCAAIEFFKSSPRGSSNVRKTLEKYIISVVKRNDLYSIMIMNRTRANIDDVLSMMQVSLTAINRKPDNEPYSLHEEFDNWSGFF